LSVALSLFARICPPEGKELVLLPVYLLLCMARLPLAMRWPLYAGEALFALLYVAMVWDDPDGMEVGFVGYCALLEPPWAASVALGVLVAYDGVSQWCRQSEAYVHFPEAWASVSLRTSDGSGCATDAALWALGRWGLLLGLSLVGRGAFAYLFLSPLPTYSSPYVPNYLGAFYGSVLLLSCMCAASGWFRCLQLATESLSVRPGGYSARRQVRLQHILHAVTVGAAWAFPIDNGWLCLGLVGGGAGNRIGGGVGGGHGGGGAAHSALEGVLKGVARPGYSLASLSGSYEMLAIGCVHDAATQPVQVCALHSAEGHALCGMCKGVGVDAVWGQKINRGSRIQRH
jgi:hypothetical protein